jgi:hypothetical protein
VSAASLVTGARSPASLGDIAAAEDACKEETGGGSSLAFSALFLAFDFRSATLAFLLASSCHCVSCEINAFGRAMWGLNLPQNNLHL